MTNSVDLYNETISCAQNYPRLAKNFYLQLVTTLFYELVHDKNSPLISEMCALNQINFTAENFKLEIPPSRRLSTANNLFDMYCILCGLDKILAENISACEKFFETVKAQIFTGSNFADITAEKVAATLRILDLQLATYTEENFLQRTAQNRTTDDEKIISAIKIVQSTMQESLRKIAEIRDDIDFRTMKEPIYQLIQLYYKLDENLKRHPQSDAVKGYAVLLKRCQSFLRYITQALAMLGVEIIDNTGETFDPNKNKTADDKKISLESTVTKVSKIGFSYKGKIIERAEVEVHNGGVVDENWN